MPVLPRLPPSPSPNDRLWALLGGTRVGRAGQKLREGMPKGCGGVFECDVQLVRSPVRGMTSAWLAAKFSVSKPGKRALQEGGTVKRHVIVLVAMGLLVGCGLIPSGGSALQVATSHPTFEPGSAIVQLAGEPLSVSPRTRPAKGAKVDFDSAAVE